jgi:D-alanyl-D-alanine carboxypeptidase
MLHCVKSLHESVFCYDGQRRELARPPLKIHPVGKKTMRTHNRLLVSLPGADGMKTGFICESGFNVVASATRDGRKIVAVVLGEPSAASRNARAADLLDKGFRRHFWKSLFGSSLDGLAMQASLNDSPRICAHVP